MIASQLSLEDIRQMTLEVGEAWAVTHAVRLMELVHQIGGEIAYDEQVMQLAAYMHDWGASAKYAQKGVEHALRSRQVVEAEILPRLDLSTEQKVILLETIEFHDFRDMRPTSSNEALLLREADMLEFLGAMGMAREFARGAKDMAGSYQRIFSRRAVIQNRFTLPRAQEIARIRFAHMDQYLHWLDEESFGAL